MLFMAVYTLAVLLQFYFVPKFLIAARPKRCMKSLKYKMICSALFMLTAVCCFFYSRNYSLFSAFMFAGLSFGLIGDLLLHYPTEKNTLATIGGGSFAIGHIFYIIAFSTEIKIIAPEAKIFNYKSVLIVLCIVGAGVITKFVKKVKFGIYTFPVFLYAVAITSMLLTAVQLTFHMNAPLTVVFTLLLGALLFVMSDTTIALLMFGGQAKNFPLKIFNIVTYFLGQTLLGTSMLFVHA